MLCIFCKFLSDLRLWSQSTLMFFTGIESRNQNNISGNCTTFLKANWFKKSPGKTWTKKKWEIHSLRTVQDILKTNYAFDNIPCTHQPCLNKLLLEVGRPASRSLLRIHSSCGCSLQQSPMWVAECPLCNQRPSRAVLTHGWWLMVDYCGFMGIFVGDDCKMGNSGQKLVGLRGSQKVNWAMLMLGKHRLRLETTCRMPRLHPIQTFCG